MNEKWPTYSIAYELDGKQWSLDVCAKDAQDARRRIVAAQRGIVEGPIVARIWIPLPDRVLRWIVARWKGK